MLFNKKPKYAKDVVNPYEEKNSKRRKGLSVEGPWVDSITKYIRKNNIEALYLNYAKGWEPEDYYFLSELDTIKELNIISSNGENVHLVGEMEQLEELSISYEQDEDIDFSKLRNLRKCFLGYSYEMDTIFSLKELRELHLNELDLDDFSLISNLVNLDTLEISNSTINDLSVICSKDIKELSLINCKKIQDISSLKKMDSLNKLMINGSKEISSFSILSCLKSLEILALSNVGDISSISFMQELRNLKAISFSGSSNIVDGDLLPLTFLPKLSMLMFISRKHYTHKLIKQWNWDNFNIPDQLLKKK